MAIDGVQAEAHGDYGQVGSACLLPGIDLGQEIARGALRTHHILRAELLADRPRLRTRSRSRFQTSMVWFMSPPMNMKPSARRAARSYAASEDPPSQIRIPVANLIRSVMAAR